MSVGDCKSKWRKSQVTAGILFLCAYIGIQNVFVCIYMCVSVCLKGCHKPEVSEKTGT